jgi:hypothetical protein
MLTNALVSRLFECGHLYFPEQGFNGNGSGELSHFVGCRSGCFGVASRRAGTI